MSAPRASVAPGAPGIDPTWSSSRKDAVAASHFSSRVWFTIGHGILNEVYWPRVDLPQIRDLGFIVADDDGCWSEVKREATHEIRQAEPGLPAITAIHDHPRYRLVLRFGRWLADLDRPRRAGDWARGVARRPTHGRAAAGRGRRLHLLVAADGPLGRTGLRVSIG